MGKCKSMVHIPSLSSVFTSLFAAFLTSVLCWLPPYTVLPPAVSMPALMISVTVAMLMAAAVSFLMLMVSVMTALYIRIVGKSSCCQSFYRIIRASGDAAVKLNSGFCQRILSSCSDSAADQRVYLQIRKKACQSAMPASICIYNLLFCNFPIFHIIDLELLRMSEVLEYFSVFIGYCYSHLILSFRRNLQLQHR